MVNFTSRMPFEPGDLVRSLGYHWGWQRPWDSAPRAGFQLKKSTEALVIEVVENLDGSWIRLLDLETCGAAWFDRWHFEKVPLT